MHVPIGAWLMYCDSDRQNFSVHRNCGLGPGATTGTCCGVGVTRVDVAPTQAAVASANVAAIATVARHPCDHTSAKGLESPCAERSKPSGRAHLKPCQQATEPPGYGCEAELRQDEVDMGSTVRSASKNYSAIARLISLPRRRWICLRSPRIASTQPKGAKRFALSSG